MVPVPPGGSFLLVCKIHILLVDAGFPNMEYSTKRNSHIVFCSLIEVKYKFYPLVEW